MNKHHIIPSSRNGANGENVKLMDERKHEAIHTLYGNKMPHEQMITQFLINYPVFKEEFRERIMLLLMEDPENMYREEMYKGKLPKP